MVIQHFSLHWYNSFREVHSKTNRFFKPDLKLSSFSMVLSDVIRKIKLETDFSGDENQPHTPYTNKQDRAVM